jgi:hypothetical protein
VSSSFRIVTQSLNKSTQYPTTYFNLDSNFKHTRSFASLQSDLDRIPNCVMMRSPGAYVINILVLMKNDYRFLTANCMGRTRGTIKIPCSNCIERREVVSMNPRKLAVIKNHSPNKTMNAYQYRAFISKWTYNES